MVESLQPILLRDHQVGELLGIHRNTVWNRVKAGKLPEPIKWEGITVRKRKEIEDFADSMAG